MWRTWFIVIYLSGIFFTPKWKQNSGIVDPQWIQNIGIVDPQWKPVAMNNLKPPKPLSLDGVIAENWKIFKRSWNVYALASGVSDKPKAVQVASFLHIIGPEALEIHDTFEIPDTDRDDINKLIEKFESYCQPKVNVTYERYVFRNIMQNSRPFDPFLVELKSKVKSCEYENLQDSLIRDQIVYGIDDASLREKLLREPKLTLEKAENLCRTAEICRA